MPYLLPAQAQKHVTHNAALQILDAVVQLSVAGFAAQTPPDPAPIGQVHALGPAPTGAWDGQAGRLAGAWLVGQALGRKNPEDARRWGLEVAVIGAVVMGVMGLVLALLPRLWLGVFIVDSPQTLELAVVPLQLLGFAMVLDGAGGVLLNGLAGLIPIENRCIPDAGVAGDTLANCALRPLQAAGPVLHDAVAQNREVDVRSGRGTFADVVVAMRVTRQCRFAQPPGYRHAQKHDSKSSSHRFLPSSARNCLPGSAYTQFGACDWLDQSSFRSL